LSSYPLLVSTPGAFISSLVLIFTLPEKRRARILALATMAIINNITNVTHQILSERRKKIRELQDGRRKTREKESKRESLVFGSPGC
jgi:hypothetical protein